MKFDQADLSKATLHNAKLEGVVIEKAPLCGTVCPMALPPTKVASVSQQRGYEISLCWVNEGAKNN